MDGLIAFHVPLLSLDCSQNDLHLTEFLTKVKRVFHVLILSLVLLGSGYTSDRIYYGQASTYCPCHTHYFAILVFVCPYVRTTLAQRIW